MSESNAQSIIDLAVTAGTPEPLELGGLYAVTLPHGGSVEIVDTDTDEFRETPKRKAGTYRVFDVESLVDYLTKHGNPASTEVFVDPVKNRITAVVDSHQRADDPAGWGQHQVVFDVAHTPAWKAWSAVSGNQYDQLAFAEFIEDNAVDIHTPTGAEMLEIAQTLIAKKGVDFESSQIVSTGQANLVYKETIASKAGQSGNLEIPRVIHLILKPFEGAKPWKVEARFRYRINGGNLTLGIKLTNPEEIVRSAFNQLVQDFTQGVADEHGAVIHPGMNDLSIPVYIGSPRA